MKNTILLGICALAFICLAGCTSILGGPAPQYLCDDGKTVVTDMKTCPVVDKAYLECEAESSKSTYDASDRDICFFNLALDRENVSLCKKVRNPDAYSYSTYTAGKCGAQIALSAGDPSLCEELPSLSKSDCYSELSTQLNDVTMCQKITSATQKDTCIYDYVTENSYYITDWSICDKMTAAGYNRNYCYNLAAENTRDLRYCDKLSATSSYSYYTKPECYASVASAESDPSICGQLNTTKDKDSCYYSYATQAYDDSVCQNITDQYKRDDCSRYANYSYYY